MKNFHFRDLTQGIDETFPAFCNRTAKEAKHDVKLREDDENRKRQPKKVLACFYCGLIFSSSIAEHREQCKAKSNRCKRSLKVAHFAIVCRSSKPLRKVEFNEEENNSENEEEDPDMYNINIFRIKANENAPMCKLLSKLENKNDFKCEER